jgi:hypothetical protein
MAITGNLQTMNLAELLQWLSNGQQTGTLIINDGEIEKRIFLDQGKILSSSSTDPTGFLGHFLVSKGVISEEQLADAISIQEEYGGMLGEILVNLDALDQETLDRMLQAKAEENIYDLFAWEEGSFEFLDGELPEYELVPMAANVTGLIMEGMRRLDHSNRIKELIPSLECVPVSVTDLLDDEDLDPGWRGVLEAVDDDRSVQDICLHTHSNEFFVCEVLFEKINEGRIKMVRPRVIEVGAKPADDESSESVPASGGGGNGASRESLLEQANGFLEEGNYEQAARHARAAASLDPNNKDLALLVKEFDARMIAAIEEDGIRLEATPVLEKTLENLRSTSFSPEEGFILSRINGTSDLASIVKVSPLPKIDSLLVFKKLVEDGHIRLLNLLDED